MAVDKKSIIVYAEWVELFEELEDIEAGKLIKHFFRYVNDQNPEAPDRITKLAFIPIQQTLKRDLKKYENYIEKQKANGKKGGRPLKTQSQITQPFISEPKKTDSVNDNVNDNVNEEEERTSTSSDSLFSVLDLELKYLKNKKTLKAVLENFENKFQNEEHLKDQLRIFTKELIERNIHTKTESDFASHFRSWNKLNTKPKKIDESDAVLNSLNPNR